MMISSGAIHRLGRCLALPLALGTAGLALGDEASSIAQKPTVKSAAQSTHRNLTKALNERVSWEFNSVSLQSVVKSIREKQGIAINIDRGGPGKLIIDQNQLVSCELVGVRLQAALDQLLDGLELDWVIVDDALLITTPAKAASLVEIRFYNVADICGDAPHVRQYQAPSGGCSPAGCAPALGPQTATSRGEAPSAMKGAQVRLMALNEPFSDEPEADPFAPSPRRVMPGPAGNPAGAASIPLIELIEKSITANWKEQAPFGRPVRSLEKRPHILVIRQPQRVHREIDLLLSRLRTEMNRPISPTSDGLETVAYSVAGREDLLTQLIRAAVVSQPGQNADAQEILKLAEGRAAAANPSSEQIGDALIDLVEPETWKKNGGQGEMRVLTGAILVRQTPAVHSLIEKTLSTLSGQTSTPIPSYYPGSGSPVGLSPMYAPVNMAPTIPAAY